MLALSYTYPPQVDRVGRALGERQSYREVCMALLHGTVIDPATGRPCAAKVHVLDSGGNFRSPRDSVLKVGPGLPFFYCEGEFTLEVPVGQVDVLVERGTEYVPLRLVVHAGKSGSIDLVLPLERWTDLPSQGWHPGNTHIHYDEKEQRPDQRLRLEPHVNQFAVTAISILQRWDLDYATNKYPVGMLTDFSTAHHVVINGEETRHNKEPWEIGYGHVMLLNIRNVVEPLSRGVLVDRFTPDYPPLCYACDDARSQGGVVIWCHSGNGMEVSVAAALGKLDAFNLFDPQWQDPEYEVWYRLLTCGIRLPASTGSDWFVCSNNRVYVHTGGAFTYQGWLEGLKAGRTFITNGPALHITANGASPGDVLEVAEGPIEVTLHWRSHYPLNKVEVVLDGQVVESQSFPQGSTQGQWTVAVPVRWDGWVAGRCSGESRDSFHQAVYAHTSPVYLRAGRLSQGTAQAAAFFVQRLEEGMDWVRHRGRFTRDSQREEVLDLFRQGQEVYRRLAGKA